MVRALDSGSSGPRSSPGRGHRVVFLGKKLYFHRASLHPSVQMGTSKYPGAKPSGGSSITPSHFMLRKPELGAGPMGHLLFFLHLGCLVYQVQYLQSYKPGFWGYKIQ